MDLPSTKIFAVLLQVCSSRVLRISSSDLAIAESSWCADEAAADWPQSDESIEKPCDIWTDLLHGVHIVN